MSFCNLRHVLTAFNASIDRVYKQTKGHLNCGGSLDKIIICDWIKCMCKYTLQLNKYCFSVYFTEQTEDQPQIGVIAGSISAVVVAALVTIGLVIIMFRCLWNDNFFSTAIHVIYIAFI